MVQPSTLAFGGVIALLLAEVGDKGNYDIWSTTKIIHINEESIVIECYFWVLCAKVNPHGGPGLQFPSLGVEDIPL